MLEPQALDPEVSGQGGYSGFSHDNGQWSWSPGFRAQWTANINKLSWLEPSTGVTFTSFSYIFLIAAQIII